ncbi:imm11 family protein [Archangium lansingense]|uniref:Immunity MXAN-0049 protein domain-containing protein n=1 Tax=Archangium lansingense TaxID=2995310 RepID=A0ABT4AND7_9BACT|nr:DUF1629 domain-containing protein [Archangium lansinium]MCY1083208.1 hypothetical protein [Archangium lansinium]
MSFRELDTMGDINNLDLCYLDDFVEGIKIQSWRVGRGVRVGELYPEDAKILMRPENPGVQLSSLLGNSESMLVASRDFREAIEKLCANVEIEYLPFTLYDHHKRPYSRDYCIINPIGTFDCLDLKASDIVWDTEKPDNILRIEEAVLDREKTRAAPQLFRLKESPHTYVVGLDLAKEMQQRKLTNVFWTRLRFNDEL